jgi:transposase InsO family protein
MPWTEVSVAEQRLEFVMLARRRETTMTVLCRRFGITRQTGYKWLGRYEEGGAAAVLEEQSRRPQHSPRETEAQLSERIVELRRQRPDWGAKKIWEQLKDERGRAPLSRNTVHRILVRRQLVETADRHRGAVQRFEREKPNELWQMDFKGPQGFNRGVGPLSVLDDHSRYLLVLEQLGSTQAAGVRRTLETKFQECGLPETMLMDHGTPWWNAQSPWGWTTLTVWLMKQGIRLALSGYRHPQTQGKIERMHGALQAALRKRHGSADEQGWLDEFRQEYNHLRPHEALRMATPASRWQPSSRAYNPHPRAWEYDSHLEVRRLGIAGDLSWRGHKWEISRALAHEWIGIADLGERAEVFFCSTPIRELDLRSQRSVALPTYPRSRSLQR